MPHCFVCSDSRKVAYQCMVCGGFFCSEDSSILSPGLGRVCRDCEKVEPGPSLKPFVSELRELHERFVSDSNRIFSRWRASMRLAIAFVLLIPSLASAQSVSLPAQVKGDVGGWIHIKPVKVDGGQPRWRIDPELEEILPETFLPPEIAAKFVGKLVRGPAGKYRIESWCAKADTASDIATCWVIIGKGTTPLPDPPPTVKVKSLTFLVIGPTLKTAIVTEDADFRAWLKANGVGIFGIMTKAQQDANPKFAGIPSPSIVLQDQDNNVIAHNPIVANTTIEDAKSFVTRYLRK